MHIEIFLANQLLFYSYWGDQYGYLSFYILLSLLLTIILFSIGFSLSPKKISFEKSSSYECGFEPFGDAHSVFNIQFFIVGILFMLFDLELAYLFPLVFFLGVLPLFCLCLMFLFILLLVIGFVYEWKKGALDWL